VDEGRLAAFGTAALRVGLGAACLGLALGALLRALGMAGPLAPWEGGLGAVPLGAPLGDLLALVLLVLGGLLLLERAVPLAALALAALLVVSLLLDPPSRLGPIQDLGLLGGALGLLALPAALLPRLPPPLLQAAVFVVTRRRTLVRVGLALVFLLAGWGAFSNTSWYADLLSAGGSVLLGGARPTALLLYAGAGELLLSGLLLWGPPARLASAVATVFVVVTILLLGAPSLLMAKALGLLGAAVAGYCWISGVTTLENAQIGWLRAAARASRDGVPPAERG
jgi:uncharacterized membrane protein YphA (DoxX/SURF4 family)